MIKNLFYICFSFYFPTIIYLGCEIGILPVINLREYKLLGYGCFNTVQVIRETFIGDRPRFVGAVSMIGN